MGEVMQISLRGLGTAYGPTGFDSDGNPIFPLGISAGDLVESAAAFNAALNTPSEIVTVTPTTNTFLNTATGQIQKAPTPQPQQTSGLLYLILGLAAVLFFTK
jgi:hypothetical protein